MQANQTTDYSQQNGRAWDAIAAIREKKFPTADYFLNGGCTIPQNVQDALGEVQGLSVLHLQCASGTDTLSWSALGANAVGVDISPQAIAIAQQKAREVGFSTRFIPADVYDLPAELQAGTFDIVFTGGGAIV